MRVRQTEYLVDDEQSHDEQANGECPEVVAEHSGGQQDIDTTPKEKIGGKEIRYRKAVVAKRMTDGLEDNVVRFSKLAAQEMLVYVDDWLPNEREKLISDEDTDAAVGNAPVHRCLEYHLLEVLIF